jgi:argininosuccinate lyase
VMHGLPLTYNKDMQEDKEHLFDAVDTLELVLAAARGMLATISFRRERLAAASADELLAATDVADYLVKRGLPFRSSHHVVGALVRLAVGSGRRLSELTPEELREASPLIEPDGFYALLADGAWLEGKVSRGGTGSAAVREQLLRAREALAAARSGRR